MTSQGQPLELSPGEILDNKYRIRNLIGVGGMGAVYAAERLALGDLVAVKSILPSQNTEANRARFLQEARAAASIRHPNVVQIFDFGEPDNRTPYMVMEYLEGATLAQVLRDTGRLPLDRALFIFSAISGAVEAGHRRNVIHRDLKPGNVIVAYSDDGRETVKVLDFGLARITSNKDMGLTTPGSMLGTVSYMAPELIDGEKASAESDVFALGVMLYEMVTGELPYKGPTKVATIMKIADGKYESPDKLVPNLPKPMVRGIRRALAADPRTRPSTPERLAELVGAPLASFVSDSSGKHPLLKELRGESELQRSLAMPDEVTAIGEVTQTDWEDDPDELTSIGEALVQQPDFECFVGRDHELETLSRTHGLIRPGNGRIIVITGDAGVGKTHLMERFMGWGHNQGAVVLRGRFFAYEGDRPPPYETFLWMLAGQRTSAPGHELAHENRPGGTGLDPGQEKWQAFSTMSRGFLEQANGRPIVLALDDLQWATVLDLDFLAYLSRAKGSVAVMVVGTARPRQSSELSRWMTSLGSQRALTTVELERFTEEEVREWFDAAFETKLRIRPQDMRRLYRATSGNPYYLSEVVRHLIDRGEIHPEADTWSCAALDDVALPETVNTVVRAKLGELGDELKTVLETASVVGEEFRFETLQVAAAVEEERLEELLDDAVRKNVLSEQGLSPGSDYRFNTATLRNVLSSGLTNRRRRRLHRRVVDAINQLYSGDADRIAKVLCYHYHAVADWEQTLKWGLLAAAETLARHDSDSADVSLRRARQAADELREAGQPPEKHDLARLNWLTGSLYCKIGRLEEADTLLRRAVADSEDARVATVRVDTLLELADCQLQRGEFEAGIATGHSAIEAAHELGDPRRELTARLHAAKCAAPLGRTDEAIELLGPIIEADDDSQLRSLRAMALSERGWVNAKRGAFDRAESDVLEAREVARQSNNALAEYRAVSVLGLVHGEVGDPAGSIPIFEDALELSRRLSLRRREGIELHNLGESYYHLGRYPEALQRTRDALGIFIEIQDRATEGDTRVNLGRMLMAQGQQGEAIDMLERGRELAAASGRSEYEGLALLELADAHLKDGAHADARQCLIRARSLFTNIDSVYLWRAEASLARLSLATRELDEAREHAKRASALVEAQRAKLTQTIDAQGFARSRADVDELLELIAEAGD